MDNLDCGVKTAMLMSAEYTPEKLMDTLMAHFNNKNDAALSRSLRVTPSLTSKVRHRKQPITHSFMVRVADLTAWPIADIRALAGLPYNEDSE